MITGHKLVYGFIWAVCLMAGSAFAQSTLPACQGSDVTSWTNCFGTETFASGNKYVGEFKDGKSHGQGTYTLASGARHVGEFRDGKLNGQGVYTMPGDSKYVGEFKNESKQGGIDAWFYSGIRFVCCHDGVLLALTDLGVFL